jgi:hypothetical protein
MWEHDPRFGEYVYFFIGSNLSPFIAGICAYRVFARLATTRLRAPGTALSSFRDVLMLAYADPLHLYERGAASRRLVERPVRDAVPPESIYRGDFSAAARCSGWAIAAIRSTCSIPSSSSC